MATIPSSLGLLSVTNAKTKKGFGRGYLTGVLYLAPHDEARDGGKAYNVCPFAGPCSKPCLWESGHGQFKKTQMARIRKTRRWFDLSTRIEFIDELRDSIAALIRRASALGMTPALRLNGTSDIRWERETSLFQEFPGLIKYDYTKDPGRVDDWLRGSQGRGTLRHNGAGAFHDVRNYSLTFSLGGTRDQRIPGFLQAGCNVAAAWSGGDLRVPESKRQGLPPSTRRFRVINGSAIELGREYKVVDGDESDLRFLDPRGVIVGLTMKGKGKWVDLTRKVILTAKEGRHLSRRQVPGITKMPLTEAHDIIRRGTGERRFALPLSNPSGSGVPDPHDFSNVERGILNAGCGSGFGG